VSSNSNGPSRDWLKLAVSSQAKSRIKQWFKKEDKDQNINLGKDRLEKETKKLGFKLTELLKDEWLNKIANKLSYNSTEDLYASLGYGSASLNQVLGKLKELHKEYYKDIVKENIEEEIEKKVSSKSKTPTQGITIKGIDNIKVRFSKCCNPVPGDDIVGYITRGRGVSVHRSDCPNINDLSKETRFIEVEWDTRKKVSYQAEIQIKAVDRAGLLSQITQLLSEVNLVLASLNARTNKEKLALINMTLEIKNIDQLNDLMKKIRSLKGVMDVYRVST